MIVSRRPLANGLALIQSGAFVFLGCAKDRPAQPPPPVAPPPVATTIVDATAPIEPQALARVRVCSFRGHHGFPGLTVAIEDSCGERSATCTVASPPMNGDVTRVDVRVELSPSSDATCADRGTRVTGTCTLPATSSVAPGGRYPTGQSRLAPRASIMMRVNDEEVGTMQTDASGSPEPAEQCWTLPMK